MERATPQTLLWEAWLKPRPLQHYQSTTMHPSTRTHIETSAPRVQFPGPQLDALCDSQPERLLGWVSYRPASALRCSMREAAVTQALLAQQLQRSAGRQALLLLLVTTGTDHNSATVTWQYRCVVAYSCWDEENITQHSIEQAGVG